MIYIRKILNCLLDKYESSKTFVESNKKQRKISAKITRLFPEYEDETKYSLLIEVNNAVQTLELKDFIRVHKKNNDMIDSIELNINKLNEIYLSIARTPKSETNQQLLELLESYADENEVLALFCRTQAERIRNNKKSEFFSGDFIEYANILKAVSELYRLEKETYIRDFSVRTFGDSKTFKKIKSKIINLLFDYGDFPKKETILEELNLINNPGHIYIKGICRLSISGQIIDFSRLSADIAISSIMLDNIESIEVMGDKVITIENLTTFNRFCGENAMVIYLGGYHNTHRRNFIKKLYAHNPDVTYYHYGDIDAGGFNILMHLRNKTGIHFQPYRMDIATIQQYSDFTKKLTENDRKRLQNLADSEFSAVIQYMLENNCKLEQEAIS